MTSFWCLYFTYCCNVSIVYFEQVSTEWAIYLKCSEDVWTKFRIKIWMSRNEQFNPLSANATKWSNTLKQFVAKQPTNCLNVFDYFVRLALKGLRKFLKKFMIFTGEKLLGKSWKLYGNKAITRKF